MKADVHLQHLEVKDRRPISSQRHFRSLISQVGDEDVFHILYYRYETESISLYLKLGAPQLVVFPEFISEFLSLVNV